MLGKINYFREEIKKELGLIEYYKPVKKDILIVVKDQLEYIWQCVESIFKYTEDFNLYIWNNGSDESTTNYLKSLEVRGVRIEHHHKNIGFIEPNNRLIEIGESPYVILLNSDTLVAPNWDKVLVGFLQQNEDFAQVGYMGSVINSDGMGGSSEFGENIDYIPGWCFCIPRKIYQEIGLFDEKNLRFAYGEDSDFSFRLREKGWRIYSLHLDLVRHYENVTVKAVRNEIDTKESFINNHSYINKRWSKFLKRG